MRDIETKGLNDLLVNVFNTILKIEEVALKESYGNAISLTEIHTLAAIGMGKPRTMTEVANELMINVSTLTTAVAKLVRKGYVKRFKGDADRRIVRIELTEAGIAVLGEHEEFHRKMVAKVVENLGEEEAELLTRSMGNLVEFFKKQYEELK